MKKIIEPLSEEFLFSPPESLDPGLYRLRKPAAPQRPAALPEPQSSDKGGRHAVRKRR